MKGKMMEARKKFYPARLETRPDATIIIGLDKH